MADVKVSQWTKVNLCSEIICGRDYGTDFMFSCFAYRFPNAINICDTSLTMRYTGLNKGACVQSDTESRTKTTTSTR